MIVVVGLGNPGKKFEKTRHSVGFLAVESLKLKVKSFSDWRNSKKFQSEISEGEISGQKVILARPQTFMNNSGKAVKILNTRYRMQDTNLWVIHDDIDLLLGKIKISKGRSSAGHKGVESIIKELKTKNFVRFRVGIKPEKIENTKQKIENFVLQKFDREEEKTLKEVIKKTVGAIEMAIKEGMEKAMAKYNK